MYRLFHQALNDALLRHGLTSPRGQTMSGHSRRRSSASAGRAAGKRVPGYLLRSLPGHAQAGGLVDDLLADDAYLLHADLRRLLQAAETPASATGAAVPGCCS